MCPIVCAQHIPNCLAVVVFFTKLGMVVYYQEAMCHVEKFAHYLQCQGHSDGLCNQNITLISELLILWQPNLV